MTPDIPAVALDCSAGRFDRAGSGSYTRWLAEGLTALMGDQLRSIELSGSERRVGATGWRKRVETLRHDVWWTQVGVIREARRAGAALLHMPTVLAPTNSTMPLVVTIHDLSVLRFPANFSSWFRTWARLTLPRIARTAALIITDSSASRDDLLDRWRVLEHRVAVVPLGIPRRDDSWRDPAHLSDVRRRYGVDRPFVLTVGHPEPRKNLPRLVRAIHQLRGTTDTREVRLVHAGPHGWLDDSIRGVIAELGLESAVQFIGYVPDADLPALYALARVTAYPSLFEGFGLPIVEAMASGCAVVTSKISSMPEVAGDAAILVDPTNVDELADGIRRLWVDDDLRRMYQARGLDRSARFTVDNMAAATLAAYQRVQGDQPSRS